MKNVYFLLFLLAQMLSVALNSQSRNQAYLDYIQTYYPIAQKQQSEYGIPASITLAQGLIESNAGMGELARQSNNHFGIKCTSDWQGEKVYHDDDMKGDCFRKYDEVLQSYEDHSHFLRNRSRYAFLFQLSATDYQGWALGLKQAGYATDPNYAVKLINVIQLYELNFYDISENKGKYNTLAQKQKQNVPNSANEQSVVLNNVPNTNAEPHIIYTVNGVKFVIAIAGDSYSAIADEFNVSQKQLLGFNELVEPTKLKVGTHIFVQKKKSRAACGYKFHKLLKGESILSVSQSYGVRMESIRRLNKLKKDDAVASGTVLKLRNTSLFDIFL